MEIEKKLTLWQKTCGTLLKVFGWTIDGEVPKEQKAIILVAPHTSIFDFVIPYLFYKSKGETPHALVKKEMFKGPWGWFLKKLGAIPLDRKNPTASIKKVIDDMRGSEQTFHLAIAPEGTRKPVKKWKTGYHTFAKALDCPVYLGYMDWKTKHIGVGVPFPLTDDARKDTEMIQLEYGKMAHAGKHPDRFIYQ